jgi:hypothetical protein
MLTVELMGGLGNQLFQIFTLMAYSKKYNKPFLLEKKTYLPGQYVIRNVYWDTFLDKLSHRLIQNVLNYPIIHEQSFEYKELPNIQQEDINKQQNYKLHGYFQSYKYFQDYKTEILNDIGWSEKKQKVLGLIPHSEDILSCISLHFRIGDYTKLQNFHPIMTLEYYINAINYIIERDTSAKSILYFCEENDVLFVTNEFLKKLQQKFPSLSFVQADSKMKDWEQMILMSCCNHHIIANSTFSWWGAYLAEPINDNKIVCYPDKWFGVSYSEKNVSDLFPSSWVKCETEIGKYLLENVYYINLENRKDRKEHVENEMKKMRWKCERFNAIRLKDGRLGCSISHLKLLEMAKEKRLDYIVIIEDDIQFTKPEEYNSMLVEFNSFMQQTNLDYDVLMIAGNLRGPVSHLSKFIYRVFNSFVAAGYIVKKHYYDTIIQNYREGIYKLLQNPNSRGMYEVDVYWKKLQAKDRWYIFMPRTVTQLPNFSTIENRYADYNYLMLD